MLLLVVPLLAGSTSRSRNLNFLHGSPGTMGSAVPLAEQRVPPTSESVVEPSKLTLSCRSKSGQHSSCGVFSSSPSTTTSTQRVVVKPFSCTAAISTSLAAFLGYNCSTPTNSTTTIVPPAIGTNCFIPNHSGHKKRWSEFSYETALYLASVVEASGSVVFDLSLSRVVLRT